MLLSNPIIWLALTIFWPHKAIIVIVLEPQTFRTKTSRYSLWNDYLWFTVPRFITCDLGIANDTPCICPVHIYTYLGTLYKILIRMIYLIEIKMAQDTAYAIEVHDMY